MNKKILIVGLGQSLAISLNRAADAAAGFTIPADGWFQIGTVGEMDKELEMPGGKKVVVRQVVTADDLATIANRFKEWAGEPGFDGLLVDFDHESADATKSTRAAAWIMNAERRKEKELWGQLRLSASGRTALEGGDFRHFSPVLGFESKAYNRGDVAHPAALLGGAFTNQPTFRGMLPLSNRADPNLTLPTMNKTLVIQLLAALGQTVAADATPEVLDAAVTTAITKAKGMETEMGSTQNRLKILLDAEIQRDLDAAGLQGDERAKWQTALTKNREEALPLLASLGKGGDGYARTHNRKEATTPADQAATAAAELDGKRDAAVRDYQTRNRCDFQTAWDATKTDQPKLFATSR
ncbi:MAG: phage protease [Opitutaceae bacterium]|jgi:hypothetical protein